MRNTRARPMKSVVINGRVIAFVVNIGDRNIRGHGSNLDYTPIFKSCRFNRYFSFGFLREIILYIEQTCENICLKSSHHI